MWNFVLQPLKIYLNWTNAYGHQTWQDGGLHGGLQTFKSLDPLITWSSKIMWQIKNLISPLLKRLWPLNLAGWSLTLRGSYPQSQMTLFITWSCPITRQVKNIISPVPQCHHIVKLPTWLLRWGVCILFGRNILL